MILAETACSMLGLEHTQKRGRTRSEHGGAEKQGSTESGEHGTACAPGCSATLYVPEEITGQFSDYADVCVAAMDVDKVTNLFTFLGTWKERM